MKIYDLIIVGGGIGGMEAARILTLRGHKASIYKKGSRLGGVFNAAAAPDFKAADKAQKDIIKEYSDVVKYLDKAATGFGKSGVGEDKDQSVSDARTKSIKMINKAVKVAKSVSNDSTFPLFIDKPSLIIFK